ncbi:MAG TPA: hypothetical protein VFN97_23510 [Actinospica sp.]|nr:hypothetical protein [Actinospica sp.]
MPHTPRRSSAARPRRPADRRDEIVAATLVGMVVVLLGYASGIGGSAGAATPSAGSTPGAVAEQPSANPTGPAPVIVSATGGPSGVPTSDPGGYYVYASGDGSGTLPTGDASVGAGAASAPAGVPTPQPSATGGATTVVVGGGAGGTATPTASASATPGTAAALDCVLGSNGITSVLPTSAASGSLLGGVVANLDNNVESALSGLFGTCTATATATPTPSATP